MKPFDLQAALRGEPVCDECGNASVQVAHFPDANADCRLAVLWKHNGIVQTYTDDGRYVEDDDPCLFMAPKKVTKWGRLLRNKGGTILYTANLIHDSKEQAENEPVPPLGEFVCAFPIEFEE